MAQLSPGALRWLADTSIAGRLRDHPMRADTSPEVAAAVVASATIDTFDQLGSSFKSALFAPVAAARPDLADAALARSDVDGFTLADIFCFGPFEQAERALARMVELGKPAADLHTMVWQFISDSLTGLPDTASRLSARYPSAMWGEALRSSHLSPSARAGIAAGIAAQIDSAANPTRTELSGLGSGLAWLHDGPGVPLDIAVRLVDAAVERRAPAHAASNALRCRDDLGPQVEAILADTDLASSKFVRFAVWNSPSLPPQWRTAGAFTTWCESASDEWYSGAVDAFMTNPLVPVAELAALDADNRIWGDVASVRRLQDPDIDAALRADPGVITLNAVACQAEALIGAPVERQELMVALLEADPTLTAAQLVEATQVL